MLRTDVLSRLLQLGGAPGSGLRELMRLSQSYTAGVDWEVPLQVQLWLRPSVCPFQGAMGMFSKLKHLTSRALRAGIRVSATPKSWRNMGLKPEQLPGGGIRDLAVTTGASSRVGRHTLTSPSCTQIKSLFQPVSKKLPVSPFPRHFGLALSFGPP